MPDRSAEIRSADARKGNVVALDRSVSFSPRDDTQGSVRQRPLQRLCLGPRRAQPRLPFAGLGQDRRHRLGIDCADLGVGSVVSIP